MSLLNDIARHAQRAFAEHEDFCPRETWVKDGYVWATDLRIVARMKSHGAERLPAGCEPASRMQRVVLRAGEKIPAAADDIVALEFPELPAIIETKWCEQCGGRAESHCKTCDNSDEPIVRGNEYLPILFDVPGCYVALLYVDMLKRAGVTLLLTSQSTSTSHRNGPSIPVFRFERAGLELDGAVAGIHPVMAERALREVGL